MKICTRLDWAKDRVDTQACLFPIATFLMVRDRFQLTLFCIVHSMVIFSHIPTPQNVAKGIVKISDVQTDGARKLPFKMERPLTILGFPKSPKWDVPVST